MENFPVRSKSIVEDCARDLEAGLSRRYRETGPVA